MDLGLHYRAINLNDHLKDSWTGIVSLSIYRRSYLETDKKGGDSERAGSCAHMWQLRNWRDISGAKVPHEECGISIPLLDPIPRAWGPKIGSCIWQWKSVVSLSAGKRWESARMPGALLKGQLKELALGHSPGVQIEGSWLRVCGSYEEHIWVVWPQRENGPQMCQ